MKKLFCVLLCLLCGLCLLPTVAAANPVTEEGLYYEIVEDTVIIVDCVESTSGALVIPAEIDGKPVTAIRKTAFYGCQSLSSVTIPEGVTSIGDQAFGGCIHLTEVTIPTSVISIGFDAFHNTAYYNDDANWDSGLLYIDGCVVASRADLTEAILNEGTRLIAGDAFFGSAITAVSIPASVTHVGDRAFMNCTALADLHFGGTAAAWEQVEVGAENDLLLSATLHPESQLEKPAPAATTTPEKPIDWWLWVCIGSGALAVASGVATVISRKKQKAAEAAEETSAPKKKEGGKSAKKSDKKTKK